MLRIGIVCFLALFQFGIHPSSPVWARESATQGFPENADSRDFRISIEISAVSNPPVIDGVLKDPIWKEPPLKLGEWLSYSPLYGEKMAQRTEVWVARDDLNLYFAFRCLDPDPNKIKTSISRRDTISSDDWIGLSLDAMGNGQSTYEMMVNPSGVQADLLSNAASGEDSAPDWVWESSGVLTENGYAVEIRLPLKSIRFKSGKDVRMGIAFFRRVSRLGMTYSWPHLPPGQSFYARHAPLILHDVKRPLTLEAIPNVTYSFHQDRSTSQDWGSGDSKLNAGLTVKYGISSSVTFDGTIKPDFSQIESDAFQIEVNQRYPVFYSEKRPFFMEGMGAFGLAGSSSDSNIKTAVHTRRIIDPVYGLKLTGTVGKVTFAALSASDQAPGSADSPDPYPGERKAFNIARVFYGLGKGSYAGALFTDTEFAGGHNRVAAGDISLQVGDHQHWSATLINSGTLLPGDGSRKSGAGGQIYYLYDSKRYIFEARLEHYDKDFQMDTAFYDHTGFTSGCIYSAINFYPDATRHPWFKKFSPFFWVRHGKDQIQGGVDQYAVAGLQMSFTRQGSLRIDTGLGKEPWAGREFFVRRYQVIAGAQLTNWFKFETNFRVLRSVFYDPLQPFSGSSKSLHLGITVQPNSKFNQYIAYDHMTFDRISSGARVYTVDIINSRTVYQFNKHFFLRAILQYDSSRTRVLTDFLGSYELVPGTVAYAGYGSLFERQQWDGEQTIASQGDYRNTQRSLFFKISYLYRF